MGRSRYVPLGTFAAATFLAQQLFSRYGYLLRKREKEKYLGLDLSNREIQIMQILWKDYPLIATDWYSYYSKTFHDKELTFLLFLENIHRLENVHLLKTRKLQNGQVKYFPSISSAELILKLKSELSILDGQEHPDRLFRLKYLIHQLEE